MRRRSSVTNCAWESNGDDLSENEFLKISLFTVFLGKSASAQVL